MMPGKRGSALPAATAAARDRHAERLVGFDVPDAPAQLGVGAQRDERAREARCRAGVSSASGIARRPRARQEPRGRFGGAAGDRLRLS